ncbi:HTH-type transcriptional regulator gltC [Shewanella putrefaciens]|nr:HTH-type transcriptional regulator gltC [Shewanella putrefaciens]
MMTLVHTLAVAEYLNFRHAANALGVAQSSVSARVKALEEDLGILLFERHARGVRLTEAGRHFVERIAVGIDQLDHAVKTAGMAAAGESGRLRIGIHALIPHSFLAKLIGQYREDHPGVEVEMTEGTARDAVMQLRADRLDVVFVAGTPELPDCYEFELPPIPCTIRLRDVLERMTDAELALQPGEIADQERERCRRKPCSTS